MGGATKIGSERAFQIKLPDGFNLSRVHATFTVPRAANPTLRRLEPIFIHMGGPQAHANSLKCQTATASPAEPGELPGTLDDAIPSDARILDIGCGTGQMSLFLARARREVVGADIARASLQLAVAAAQRFQLGQVQFIETDLHRPGLRESAFDVVYSSGVLHHTPNPRAAFARLSCLARPGGIIILGLYNAFARTPLRLRRLVGRLSAFRCIPFDPVLRDRKSEPARREAWLRDQYRHPEEHCHTLAEVQAWFAENGVEYVRAYPSAMLNQQPESEDLFANAPDNWRLEGWLAQIGWIVSLGHEGGLFVTIGRKF